MEKKVTKREQFVKIVAILTEAGEVELAKTIEHEIELLDKKAAKAKERAAKKNAGNDELAERVYEALTDKFQTIAQIAEEVGEATAKVQYRLTSLVKNEWATKEQIKVSDEEGKTRKVMGYKVANTVETEA